MSGDGGPEKWNPEEVGHWLRSSGHSHIWEKVQGEGICGQDLISLTRDDWKDILSCHGGSYSVVDLRYLKKSSHNYFPLKHRLTRHSTNYRLFFWKK